MKALRFHETGEPAEVLRLEERPAPEPGQGFVRVRLTARPINPSDLTFIRGYYGVKPQLPAVPGFEGAGVVEAVGPGVANCRVGQRVVPLATSETWQEQLLCLSGHLAQVPDTVSDEVAAQLQVNPFTAWVMLTRELCLSPGAWLAQSAAGSALGRLIIQLGRTTRDHPSRDGRLQGFRTVNIVRRREQADELLALGADAVICSDTEPIGERLKEITGGGPVAAIDAVGGRVGSELARSLAAADENRAGGTMLVIAALSREPVQLSAGPLIFKGQTVRGFWLTRWLRRAVASEVDEMVAELFERLAAGELSLPVAERYQLADYHAAVRRAEQPGRRGKVILVS